MLFLPINTTKRSKFVQWAVKLYDVFALIVGPLIIYYHITNYQRLIRRMNYIDPTSIYENILTICLIIIIVCAIWRAVGKPLPIFIVCFILYAFLSPLLPGFLYYQGMTMHKFTSLMMLGNEGIYGAATSAAAGFLFWMMMFGGLFSGGSGGQCLIDIGMLVGAKSKDNSAPAKAAVLSSCLFGMVSGSAAANVASTGVFTIPLMKKVGYSSEEAGAIESVASTGGQIMPPIMGTSAFLMADMLDVNYLTIAAAALIPGLVYYGAVFLLVQLMASRRVSKTKYVPIEIKAPPILPRLYMLSPIVVLMVSIGRGATIQRAALYSILTVLLLNFVGKKEDRRSILELVELVVQAARRTATVGMPLCGCGIIIGIITFTGLASRLSIIITMLGGQHLWVGLLVTMFGCMMLGMALPTVAAYLTAYVLFIPTLRALGIAMLPANMFIFYYGIFAQITPPVCVASYTAAGIAGSKPWDTGWKAFTYAAVAFFAPFVFVYQPGILLMGTPIEIVIAIVTLASGTFMLTCGVAGFLLSELHKYEKFMFVISGILICIPEASSDVVGFGTAGVLLVLHYLRSKKKMNIGAAS